jgi:hypothetical protein
MSANGRLIGRAARHLPDDSTLLLLRALEAYADDDGYCWPRVDRLAEDCRRSRSTVKRATATLVYMGLLEVTRRTVAGRQTSNGYRILWGALASLCGEERETRNANRVTCEAPRVDRRQAALVTPRRFTQVTPLEVPRELPTPTPPPYPPPATPVQRNGRRRYAPSDAARAVVQGHWEHRRDQGRAPLAKFLNICQLVDGALTAGYTPAEVRAALDAMPSYTTGTMEFALRRTHQGASRAEDERARRAAAAEALIARLTPGGP